MTKARKPLFSLNAQGKLGPLVISRLQRGSHKVAVKRSPANPNTPAQDLMRDYYGSGVETYRTLDETERLHYHNLYPRQRGHRAYLNFMKEWLMAKLPLHWLDHILSGRDEIASPLAPAAHPAYDPTIQDTHSFPPSSIYIPGRYYPPIYITTINPSGTSGLAANYLHYIPYPIARRQAFNSIQVRVTASGGPGAARLGIYQASLYTIPNTLIVDAGTIDTSITGFQTVPIAITLNPGLYYIAYLANATASIRHAASSALPILGAAPSSDEHHILSRVPYPYGNLPTTPPAPTQFLQSIPVISLCAA